MRTPIQTVTSDRFGAFIPILIGLCVASPTMAVAQNEETGEYVNAQTARLERLVGPWMLTEKHFDASGEVVAKVTGNEEITWVLDYHAIRRAYMSGAKKSQYSAMGLFAWNDVEAEYQGVWLDSTSTTGPRKVSGQWNSETQSFVFTLEVLNTDGSRTRYSIVEQFVDENQRVATTYRLSGSSKTKVIEVLYKRSRPCPGRLRIVPDQKITGG